MTSSLSLNSRGMSLRSIHTKIIFLFSCLFFLFSCVSNQKDINDILSKQKQLLNNGTNASLVISTLDSLNINSIRPKKLRAEVALLYANIQAMNS